jgi:hypothetical protein
VKTSQKLMVVGLVVVALAGVRVYFVRQSVSAAAAAHLTHA